ncbi:HEAT repeat domain-containing protein [Actinocrispum wychmicini]|uniref:Glycosyltransferase involved in cell wall biosynthesis n=1 Tax=Actinocrispum wychmicini TaxID=1213861 RepID=A0A4R2IPE8_9PSEU|nr:HEAT repeat domain-containing protein [Actinocrispum wychmicini]TCO45858.1 glycosyltransferase involved in cell wall biosynthesis [Actinocrispum wychmicini]
MPDISVIVRFRNEAKYLDAVLRAVTAQQCVYSVEVVAADNASTDGSRELALNYANKVIDISDYRPGIALNRSIEICSGALVVVLSAHAVPANANWLDALVRHLRNSGVLGVYGSQIYPSTARFLDKRDLDIFSDAHPRSEFADSDFWNANSAFRRTSWEARPFDETVIELEDHYWTKQALPSAGRWVRFEPSASVYHYGHEERNDRTFVTPSSASPLKLIDQVIADLRAPDATWPTVMAAGMHLGSLDDIPEVAGAIPVIGDTLLEHDDFDVRWRMAAALGRIGGEATVPFVIAGLRDRSFYPRDECAWSLGRIGAPAVAELLRATTGMDERTLPFAGLALGVSGLPDAQAHAIDILARCVGFNDNEVVRDAVYFLGEVGHVGARVELWRPVVDQLSAADHRLAGAAAWCCGKFARQADSPLGATELVDVARSHPFDSVRAEAVTAIGRFALHSRSERWIAELERVLATDCAGNVRYSAMQALRLSAKRGWSDAGAAAARHHADDDFGVLFEQRLASTPRPTSPAPSRPFQEECHARSRHRWSWVHRVQPGGRVAPRRPRRRDRRLA